MKAERAKLEREELDRVLRQEGKVVQRSAPSTQTVENEEDNEDEREEEEEGVEPIPNLENMQLTLHEGLFLSQALDVLDLGIPRTKVVPTIASLYPTVNGNPNSRQMFMIQAAVYHHYRSHGWTVKSGIKFGVDWLLYIRGPVFHHAEFSVIVVPQPTSTSATRDGEKPWWWLHMLTRVNGQVKKTVILAFVEYNDQLIDAGAEESYESVLARVKIRECSVRRWIPSRNRD